LSYRGIPTNQVNPKTLMSKNRFRPDYLEHYPNFKNFVKHHFFLSKAQKITTIPDKKPIILQNA